MTFDPRVSPVGLQPPCQVCYGYSCGTVQCIGTNPKPMLQDSGLVLRSQHTDEPIIGEYLVVFLPFWACQVTK